MAKKKTTSKAKPKAKPKANPKAKPKVTSKTGGETGYCVKCKKKIKIESGKVTTMKNKRKMLKGKCPKCGTTVCRIM